MKNISKKRVFLDYASITPIDHFVQKEMDLVAKKYWGNPSSIHFEGEMAKNLLSKSRLEIAKALHCRAEEVIFTGSGTESLNLAIFGLVKAASKKIKIPHVITSSIEHPAVLEPIRDLLRRGLIEVSFLNPNEEGLINPDSVRQEIKDNTVLVVIQHANNEIGVIEPVRKIALLIAEFKKEHRSIYPYLLVDASQSFLYEEVTLERLQADLLVIDGIKIYGPRGVALLVARKEVPLEPIIFGGGQEKGLRSGTENLPAVSGLAKAVSIAVQNRKSESKRILKLRDYLIDKILKQIEGSSLNGSLKSRLPNNANICFKNQDSEFLVIKLDTLGFAVSASSACNSLTQENFSYVVRNIGSKDCERSSLRFTLGRYTTKTQIDKLLKALKKVIK